MALPSYPHSDPDSGSASGTGPHRDRRGRTPRWVSVAGIVLAVALVVVLVVLHVTGVVGPGAN